MILAAAHTAAHQSNLTGWIAIAVIAVVIYMIVKRKG